ncbi:hypothetical protein niasHS_006651 [Heterodera schachtii]|uniref:Uncharacterized protein n=1 Tax=Heterodera schachtii TaxID=97005 RepID=A0ABD2JHU9_HETSC
MKFNSFKENADKFMFTKTGRYVRLGLLAATVCAYPVIKVCSSGPLLSTSFKWRVKIDTELPEHLEKTINEQTFLWLEKVGKIQSDTHCTFSCLKDASASLDSISLGTSSFSTGAQIALPFYVKFRTADEAKAYAKEHFEPFKVLGKVACVVWESRVGRQLLSTFVLSDEALAFLVARDLFSVKETYMLTRDALTWFCYTLCYMSCFYVLHATVFKGSFLSFVLVYPLLAALSVFTAKQWNDLATYANERQADMEAAKMSQLHTRGGREFYSKFLLRNRLLRELVDGGDKLFTEVGDYRKAIAEYVLRYDDIGTVRSENEQLSISMEGDDIPEGL